MNSVFAQLEQTLRDIHLRLTNIETCLSFLESNNQDTLIEQVNDFKNRLESLESKFYPNCLKHLTRNKRSHTFI